QNILSIPQGVADFLMRACWPMACRQADVVIAPSESLHRILNRVGVKRPIVTVENGIMQQSLMTPAHTLSKIELGIPETAVLLIYVGRLSKEKNLTHLLKQFQNVVKNAPDTHLLLVGDGPERERLQKLSQFERLSKHITFIGAVSPATVPNYLALANMFVTASQSEVHPLTLLEAMAAGLPIVAPDASGNRDIVAHQETGLLVDDLNTLADAILHLQRKPQLHVEMSQLAAQRSRRFTIDETVQKTLDVYQKLLTQQSPQDWRSQNGRLSARLWAKMVPKRSMSVKT
ncbi:MAG: glycosyltransferase, partial [Chloroflexota bacterium]